MALFSDIDSNETHQAAFSAPPPLQDLIAEYPNINQLKLPRMSFAAIEEFANRNGMPKEKALNLASHALRLAFTNVRGLHTEHLEAIVDTAIERNPSIFEISE